MIKVPVGQKRLTNIAIVHLEVGGKRFEIACYRNKVLNWREGIEKDLSEVIQADTVFSNVGKGNVAKKQDLKKAFGTNDLEEICKRILKSGELQVSDKEREVHNEGVFRDIVQIVVERCVHPQTGRQHTALSVENALKSIKGGFNMKGQDSAKKQALKAIGALVAEFPDSFARAKMRLRIVCPERLRLEIRQHLTESCGAKVEDESGDAAAESHAFTFTCDPSHYRQLDQLATVTHKDEGVALQIITATVLLEASDAPRAQLDQAPDGGMVVAASARPPAAALSAGAAAGSAGAAAGEAKEPPKKTFNCSTCGATFEDVAEYRLHCRSDLHNFNLKRKVKALPPVSEAEFAEISLDTREGFIAVDS